MDLSDWVHCVIWILDAEANGDKHSLALWLKDVAAIKAARLTISQSEDVEAVAKIDERVTGVHDAMKGKDTTASLSESALIFCLISQQD